jgi:regulator of replication initiation timing
MGRTKGSKNKQKKEVLLQDPIEDLKYEVEILKAALKEFIREQKQWRLNNEKIRALASGGDGSSLNGVSVGAGGVPGL